MQFSYIDGDDHVFMNMETFEEERIPSADIDKRDFIKEEDNLQVLVWRGKAIDVQVEGQPTRPAAAPLCPRHVPTRCVSSQPWRATCARLFPRGAGAEDGQHEGGGGGTRRQGQHRAGPCREAGGA